MHRKLQILLVTVVFMTACSAPRKVDDLTTLQHAGAFAESATIATLAVFAGDVTLMRSLPSEMLPSTPPPARSKSGSDALRRSGQPESITAEFLTAIHPGDKVQTAENGQVRIVFENGDILQLGPNTALQFGVLKDHLLLWLSTGLVSIYSLPDFNGNGIPIVVHTDQGQATVSAANVAIRSNATTKHTSVMVFNGAIEWRDSLDEQQVLPAGSRLQSNFGISSVSEIEDIEKAQINALTSPLAALLEQAVVAFQDENKAAAEALFQHIQAAFPYSGDAAYYLGALALHAKDPEGAIRQWQRYEVIDPDGAKLRGVPLELMRLNMAQLKREIAAALRQEDALRASPAEPNTIAVFPFANDGSAKLNPIGKGLAALVISDLAKIPGLKVIERAKVQKLLDELKLSQSELMDKNDLRLRLGGILRAEKIILGRCLVE